MTGREQIPTKWVSIRAIVRSKAFARGVDDVRAGRRPRFDLENSWEYERGRQWAIAAPPTMPLKLDGRINPAAVQVFLMSDIP